MAKMVQWYNLIWIETGQEVIFIYQVTPRSYKVKYFNNKIEEYFDAKLGNSLNTTTDK